MKNLFLISEEDKNRILNLHENATKRQYLTEQSNSVNPQYDALTIKTELDKFDSDEGLIVKVIKKYKQDNFKSLLDTYKNLYDKELGKALYSAIQKGTDDEEIEDLTEYLDSIGYSIELGNYDSKTRTHPGWVITSNSETQAAQTQDELIKKVSDAVAPAKTVKGTVYKEKAALVSFPNSNVFFTEVNGVRRFFEFTKDNKTQTRKGFWSIVDGKMTYKEDSAKAENKTNTSTNKVAATTPSTPSDTDLDNYLKA